MGSKSPRSRLPERTEITGCVRSAPSGDQISGRGTCKALCSGCLPWPSPMPTPPRSGLHPSGMTLHNSVMILLCPRRIWSSERKHHSAGSQPGLLSSGHGEAWHPQHCPFLDRAGYLGKDCAALCLHFLGPAACSGWSTSSGQGGALYASFQRSGWGPWPAGLASHPGSPSLAPQACASVGGQPAPTCTLHTLSLSPHGSQGGPLSPLQIRKLLRVMQGLVPRPM